MVANWIQVNKDGFGYSPGSSATSSGGLFTFGGKLYAHDVNGLFRMDSLICRSWPRQTTPTGASELEFLVIGAFLFCWDTSTNVWFIKQGETFTKADWHKITSTGPSGSILVSPMTIFKGQVYGVHYDAAGAAGFDVLRSTDLGKQSMTWQTVASNGFSDSQNNTSLDFMGAFNNKLYAGTGTVKGNFGDDPTTKGVQIWESPTGDPGSWSQVNDDGFGTQATAPNGKTFPTNHVIGSWATYRGPNQTQEYLYIGTKSHWGAEVWRYDGKGKQGWKNLTPSWAGVPSIPIGGGPGRNEAMTVFQNKLFLGEGFPTGNIAAYDGKKWTIAVNGPTPFHADNGGVSSMTLHGGKLYAKTLHQMGAQNPRGDQVYGYPLNFVVWIFACAVKTIVFWLPLKISRWIGSFTKTATDAGQPVIETDHEASTRQQQRPPGAS